MASNKSFYHYQPTRLHFGTGRLNELGQIARFYGHRCLLITPVENAAMKPLFDRVKELLTQCGAEVFCFQKVTPNPDMRLIDEAIQFAHENQAEVVIAVGGGSAIDTAKITAYCAADGRADWDAFMLKQSPFNFTERNPSALALIAVPTTSGTGSQVTQCAVISHASDNLKHGIHRKGFFPVEAIIDPELTQTLPDFMTASTAFDAFCHLCESSMKHILSPIDEILAQRGLSLIIETLPKMKKGLTLEDRSALALADTMAGICLANAGGGLPHHLGELITSAIPRINHGQSLAITFPAFTKVFFADVRYHNSFIDLMKQMNGSIHQESSITDVLNVLYHFLDAADLNLRISDFNPDKQEIEALKAFIEADAQTGLLMAMLNECGIDV